MSTDNRETFVVVNRHGHVLSEHDTREEAQSEINLLLASYPLAHKSLSIEVEIDN